MPRKTLKSRRIPALQNKFETKFKVFAPHPRARPCDFYSTDRKISAYIEFHTYKRHNKKRARISTLMLNVGGTYAIKQLKIATSFRVHVVIPPFSNALNDRCLV